MTNVFGGELRRLRELAGLSLGEMADRVHYSKGHLSNVEAGRKRPTMELARRCEAALGATDHLIGLVEAEATSTQVGRAGKPAQLPASVSPFVGRATALTRLDSILGGGAVGASRIVAVDGPPGIGKTALVLQWARKRAERFPDGVLYADLGGYGGGESFAQPAHALDQFLRALGVLGTTTADNLPGRSALLRSVLDDRRMLVVLDNASSSDQVRPLLPGWPGCIVLVTSRTRLSGLVIREGATRITLPPLLSEEALSLVRNLLGDAWVDAEPEAAAQLIDHCAFLPLAVRIAAERARAHPSKTIAELAHDLAEPAARLDLLSVDDGDSSVFRTVVRSSYDTLGPAPARMFRLISAHPGRDISTPAAAALVGVSRSAAERTLDHLASVSLLNERGPNRYSFPPLLHIYAVERLQSDDPAGERLAALDRVLAWYVHTVVAAARAIGPHGRHLRLHRPTWLTDPLPFTSYLDALSWCDVEYVNLTQVICAAADEGFDAAAWQLAVSLGPYWDLRKAWQTWTHSQHLGLSAARRAGNRVAEAWLLTGLAAAHRDIGRLDEAWDFVEESLAIQRETGDLLGEALSLIQMGKTLAAQGQLDAALSRFLAALQILPNISDRRGEATALIGAAAVYCEANQHHAARDPLIAALAISRRLRDRRVEGAALAGLAVALHGMGRLEEALVECDFALEAWRDMDDRHSRAVTLDCRGSILLDLGRSTAAGVAWRKALITFEELGDPRASDLRIRLHGLGPVPAVSDDVASL